MSSNRGKRSYYATRRRSLKFTRSSRPNLIGRRKAKCVYDGARYTGLDGYSVCSLDLDYCEKCRSYVCTNHQAVAAAKCS